MKSWLSGILAFAVTTAAMLLLGEWVVRILYADSTVLFPRYHTDVQYGDFTIRRIRPDSSFRHTSIDGSWEFVTNSQGFRSSENFSYQKPEGVYRVLVLGDSHTQGYEVRQEHTFSAVLERYLRKNGINAQVINTGVSGFSTAEALILLENEGFKYEPDAVVLGFFANDFEDNLKAGIYELDAAGELGVVRQEYIPGVRIQNVIYSLPAVRWLGENSYFYSMLFNTTWEFFKARLARQANQYAAEFAVPQKSEYSRYEIDLAYALLDRIHYLCKQRNIPFMLLDIPSVDSGDHVSSSFPADFMPLSTNFSTRFIHSSEIFADFINVIPLHVPNGHRHIAEFSHALLGVESGKAILQASSSSGR